MSNWKLTSRGLILPALIFLCWGGAAAQVVGGTDKTDKAQKSLIVPDYEDKTARPLLVVDFAAELKASQPETPGDAPAAKPPQASARAGAAARCTTRNPIIDQFVRSEAHTYGVNPCLVMLIMGAESAFKQHAISHKGAMGLMQLIPATAVRFGVKNVFNPQDNIRGGTAYLRWLLNYFNNDLRLALAGYNAGEGAVVKYHYNVPPYEETQRYVRLILGQYQRIAESPVTAAAPAIPAYQIVVDFETLQEGRPIQQPQK